jgi:hypothetical protein
VVLKTGLRTALSALRAGDPGSFLEKQVEESNCKNGAGSKPKEEPAGRE